MKTITYNLKNKGSDSDKYYVDIETLTSNILSEQAPKLNKVINAYKVFLQNTKLEKCRDNSEYFIELLALGIYARIYIGYALSSSIFFMRILYVLFLVRNRFTKLKPYIDNIRGKLASKYICKIGPVKRENLILNFGTICRLMLWLKASGEFKEEIKRFELLIKFLSTMDDSEIVELSVILDDICSEFENTSKKTIGEYTANVDNFRVNSFNKYFGREDLIFSQRREIEYHLNLVWSEILNRIHRANFAKTNKRAILVPGCMRINEERCKATTMARDKICIKCNPKCNIAKLTADGEKNNYNVYIIPHATDFSKWIKKRSVTKEIGVVGIACPLNLVSGGLELKRNKVEAQCVMLDYCGCKKHWDSEGFTTEINNKYLQLILGNNNNNVN